MRHRVVSLPILLLAVLTLLATACGSDDGVDAGGSDDGDTTAAEDDTPTEDDTSTEDGTSTEDDASTEDDTSTEDPGTDAPAVGEGTLVIALEDVQGFFTEGFEVGLRVEQPDGTVVSSWRWNDVVEQFGDGTARAFYETVLEEPVPAGTVVVLATVNLGIGPPPEVPDLEGEMDCRIKVEVPAGGQAQVEVNFSGTPDCLRLVS